ncbi:MAG: ISAzo13 family transposase, partial [Acidobacteriota bacterium]
REYRRKGEPERVRVHDFVDEDLGKAIPYGVYDLTENAGWVSVGTDHETAQFAVESIRRWWSRMGGRTYPRAKQLLIVADGGGGNGSRSRLWKIELQRLSTNLGIPISVSHFPPGTSKWNKIEHRMWSQVTENWRGRPLASHEVIVKLITNTTTKAGLHIKAQLDEKKYPTRIKVSDKELARVNFVPDSYHGDDWNYTIEPAKPRNR